MFRRTEAAHGAAGRERDGTPPAGATPAGNFVVDPATPKLSADIDDLMVAAPVFRTKVHGYDRFEVDNYVAWTEAEFRVARRETENLVERYGRVCAELEISRRLLARSPEGREMTVLTERMGQMLRLAADEAAAVTAAGQEEADQVLADARTEADARLRKAHAIKQMAVEASDRMREEARVMRAEAAAELDRARTSAAETLRQAEANRQRAAEEAAQVRAQAEAERQRLTEEARQTAAVLLAEAQGEVDEMHRRRDRACESLLRLNEQIGVALETVADVGDLARAAGPAQPAAV